MKAQHRLLLVLLVAITLLGCGQKTLPAYGQVVVLLSSDMPVPDSFDTLILTVNGRGRAFRSASPNAPLPDNPATPCAIGEGTKVAVYNSKLQLPSTIALTSEHDEATKLQATLTACKQGALVFTRDFSVALPESGQQRMLRAPIRWLCNDRSNSCFGCGTDGKQPCYHQNVARIKSPPPDPCEASACQAGEPGVFEAVPYDALEAASYDPASISCFEPWICLDMSDDSQFDAHNWTQVPTGWQAAPTDAGTEPVCVATVKSKNLLVTDPTLNLALVLPPSEKGFCDKNRCIVPLDRDSLVGWSVVDSELGKVLLPTAVCHMLDSGQIHYVVAAAVSGCSPKSRENLLCSQPKPTPRDPIVGSFDPPKPVIYLPLDDVSGNKYEPLNLDNRVDLPPLADAVDIGVKGQAGRFNTQFYARGANTPDRKNALTYSAWVSLTESPSADAAIMPILSNISEDCKSGVRLELRSCATNAAVYLALGRPNGSTADGARCTIDYRFTELTRTSYVGGYFNPWKIGTFYHVAATLEASTMDSSLYVDGKPRTPDAPDCGYSTTESELSDANLIYLGSEAPLAGAPPASHDILLDEVALFAEALNAEGIKRLMLGSSTQSGSSGLRWGAWSSQGSGARIDPGTTQSTFTIDDRIASCAGAYAQLETTERLMSTVGLVTASPALDGFDEAVLVVSGLPQGKPFQFALVSDHGQRQCTWQLNGSPSDGFQTYIINLSKPSWCVDPDFRFDTANVQWVSIGSDWATEQSPLVDNRRTSIVCKIGTLAFRQHPAPLAEPRSGFLGGAFGPGGWYWRSIAYDPAWDVPQAKNPSFSEARNPVSITQPTLYGVPSNRALPELGADPPEDSGTFDLTTCKYIELCLKPGNLVGENKDLRLALTNTLNQTCDWDISTPTPPNCARAIVSGDPASSWSPVGPGPKCSELSHAVRRLSVRYSGAMQINSVKCCLSEGMCIDLGDITPTKTTN